MRQFANTIIASIAVAAVGLALTTAAETAVRIKTSAIVEGPTITLGDVLEGLGDSATVPVAESPEPGKRVILRVARISAIARKHGVEWPNTSINALPVIRASRIVPQRTLESEIKRALAESGVSGKFTISLANKRLRMHVARSEEATVSIDDIRFDAESGRFSAMVSAPANSRSAERTEVRGRAFAVMEVPVLNHRVAIGDKIAKSDIDWLEIRVDQARRGIVTDEIELVGMAPKRSIHPNRPIRAGDLRRPVVVAKGATVSMVVAIPGMTLSVIGRALENGGKGDVIGIMNPQTHTVVEGTVIGPGRVVVRIAHNLVTALN